MKLDVRSFILLAFSAVVTGTGCSAEEGAGSTPAPGQQPGYPGQPAGGSTSTGGASGNANAGSPAGTGGFQDPSTGGAPAVTDGTGPTTPVRLDEDDVCEEIRLAATRSKVDLMIVLDRSGSMGDEGRWTPSVSAVRSVTQQLDECIRLGLALFPSAAQAVQIFPGFPGLGDPCAPGEIVVPISDGSAAGIEAALNATWPEGGTPTSETLRVVRTGFPAATGAELQTNAQYVLLVTDGQPTCPAGLGSDITPQDIDASNAAIEELAAQGIKSYVIGYDTVGPGRESLAQVLDGFAQRGGTGDTQHRPVEDEQSLIAELQGITGEIIQCDLLLDGVPPGPEYVRVRLDGRQIDLNDANGWQFEPPQSVVLVGSSCELMKECQEHAIEVDVLCEPLVIL